MEAAWKLIAECECEEGCPSCIHSPQCGSGNKPLDKQGALGILNLLLGKRDLKDIESISVITKKRENVVSEPEEEKVKQNYRIAFFDLETQRSADEVGGWKNKHLMKIAVGVVYDSMEQKYFSYLENQTEKLIEKLKMADLVVGFNVVSFDYAVLQPYATDDLKKLNTFDMLDDIKNRLGFRLSLNHLAEKTLKEKKSADGLQSLQWFKEGKMDLITEYCIKDVEITKKIFYFGINHKYLLYERRLGGVVRIPLDWESEKLIKK